MSLGDYKINGNELYGSKILGSDTLQHPLLSHMLDITLCHSVEEHSNIFDIVSPRIKYIHVY